MFVAAGQIYLISGFMINTMLNCVLVVILVFIVESGSGSVQIYHSQLNLPAQGVAEGVSLPVYKLNVVPLQEVPKGVLVQRLNDVPVKTPLVKPDQQIHSVSVSCLPSFMKITIQADLFHTGYNVDPAALKLGTDGVWCDVTSATPDYFIIHVLLTDCGTQYQVTDDALIYYNLLVYSPAASPDGLVRMEEEIVPVQCRYSRRIGVDSGPVTPTWLPHKNVQSAQQTLFLTLHLMNSDWRTEQSSGVYYLGDVINIEASVFMPQMDMRVHVESCVATATSDVNSSPRYKFIDNGCFVDGQQTGSRSLFRPRMYSDKLQIQLDAFVFSQVNSSQIFISCVLRANVPSLITSRACSFIHNSWKSADGDDKACAVCAGMDEPSQIHQVPGLSASCHEQNQSGSWRKQAEAPLGLALKKLVKPKIRTAGPMWRSLAAPQRRNSVEGLQQEASLGPLSLTMELNKGGVASPPTASPEVHVSHIPSLKSNRKRGNVSQTQTVSTNEETSTVERSQIIDVTTATDTKVLVAHQTESTDTWVTFTSPEPGTTNSLFATEPSVTKDTESSTVEQTGRKDTEVSLITPKPGLTSNLFATQTSKTEGSVTDSSPEESTESAVPLWDALELAAAADSLPDILTDTSANSTQEESEMEGSGSSAQSVYATLRPGPESGNERSV